MSNMNLEEEEEEYLDYNCPTGKLIKKLEEKTKKPVVDDSFSKILDEFEHITSVQDRYLVNGIFQIDFAQSALFLQSSSIYYAKRVDKLWDELLELHTRLVQYDHTHAKQIKDSSKLAIKEKELHKIEERINRGRRKKVQLVETDSQNEVASNAAEVLQNIFGEELNFDNEEDDDIKNNKLPFEPDEELIKDWKTILEAPRGKWKNISKAVWEHGHQTYKLKNYETFGKDFAIMDLDDEEEFNVKYSNAPTYHVVKHLFEYNDRCLLPDQEHTIANLRLGYNLTAKYLADNHIKPGTPYEVYKEGYERFVKDFYQIEKRKMQNLPQSTTEDLQNFYKILIHREKEALQAKSERKKMMTSEERIIEPSVTFESLIKEPLNDEELRMIYPDFEADFSDAEVSGLLEGKEKEDSVNRLDSGVMTMDRSLYSSTSGFFSNDEENNMNQSLNSTESADKEAPDTETTEKESSDKEGENKGEENVDNVILNEGEKEYVGDSGYFDTGFETDDEDEGDEQTVEKVGENGEKINESGEKNSESPEGSGENPEQEKSSEEQGKTNEDMDVHDKENVENENNNRNKIKETKQVVEKAKVMQTQKDKRILRDVKANETLKRKLPFHIQNTVDDFNDDSPIKRRKLSQKSIEKLSTSLISPVREQKWEKFFSMTYEAEVGEGIVEIIQYDSESEAETDSDLPLSNLTQKNPENMNVPRICEVIPTPPPPSDECHSDHDYATLPSPARSECVSDHDYALPPRCHDCDNMIEGKCDRCILDEEIQNELSFVDNKDDEGTGGDVDEFLKRVENDWDEIIRAEASNPLEQVEYGPLTKAEQEIKDYEVERKKSRLRVEEWKGIIMPILKKKKNEDFNIHEYGSKIMESMGINNMKAFSEFIDGEHSTEASRFFVSALQLANMGNIEFCGTKMGEYSNDTLTLKLISKERYHEHLNEFMAPSEESFREKLERVREMTKNANAASTKRKNLGMTSLPIETPEKKLKIVLNRDSVVQTSRRIDFGQTSTPKVTVTPVKRSLNAPGGVQTKKFRILINRIDSSQDSGIESCDSEPSLSQRSNLSESEVWSQPSTSRGHIGADFETSPSSSQMGPPQPIFSEVMSWKISRFQRRRSSTSDSGIMRSPTATGMPPSPVSRSSIESMATLTPLKD